MAHFLKDSSTNGISWSLIPGRIVEEEKENVGHYEVKCVCVSGVVSDELLQFTIIQSPHEIMV